MVYYNNQYKRAEIIQQMEAHGSNNPYSSDKGKHMKTFIALCIYPYSWEKTYHNIRNGKGIEITIDDWNTLGGVILGLLVLNKKKTRYSHLALEEAQADFVSYIRMDKQGDPWKFICSWKNYFYRYIILNSLSKFGIDWKELSVLAGAIKRPNPKTHNSLFTNPYTRAVCLATIAYRNYYTTFDEGYLEGTNDQHSICVSTYEKNKKLRLIGFQKFEKLVTLLIERLPNWNKDVRGKVGFYLSYMLPLHMLLEKATLDSTERKMTNADKI